VERGLSSHSRSPARRRKVLVFAALSAALAFYGTVASAAPSDRVRAAVTVTVFRLNNLFLQDASDLPALAERVAAADRIELAPPVRGDLKNLVLDPSSYRTSMAFVPACGFVASLVFEFDAPGAEPVWWIVTNCAKAALVDSGVPSSEWNGRSRFLTHQVEARLQHCNATGRWDATLSCLAE
jgi:hypothetical protein